MKASKAAKATDNKATKADLKASKYKQKAAKGGVQVRAEGCQLTR